MSNANYLSSLTQLPLAESQEERVSLFRQGIATLARAALDQQPVPLEGIDPQLLLKAVQCALTSNLFEDLSWLSKGGAAAAVYELASAIPDGPERRTLGRNVLTRLYQGAADTFVVLATSLAAESRRTLTGPPIRARVALSLALPIGNTTADALALTLLSRADLMREWLTDPSSGSLPSRRLAARLLERAARESARRAAQGDSGSLRVFQETPVRTAWNLLLSDRESLVWRHVATARGLLAKAVPEMMEEVERNLSPRLTPTEWRRAAVSLAASVTLDPIEGPRRCHDLLKNDELLSDSGLAGTMIYGLSQAAETEPEATEDLLNRIVRKGGLDAAEALVELRRERVGTPVGEAAGQTCKQRLETMLSKGRIQDDGKTALCNALIEELTTPPGTAITLRDHLDAALRAFLEEDARTAFSIAQKTFQLAIGKLNELEQAHDGSRAGRRLGFLALRELDVALLETATLSNLLQIGARGKDATAATAPLGDIFERLTNWLIRSESAPIEAGTQLPHLTLRLRRTRTLLHLVDADGSYGEDVTGQRRLRRTRTARALFVRARHDAASPMRRTVCAALARSCDALIRDDICELSDVLVSLGDNVAQAHDLRTIAEASMMDDLQRTVLAYADILETAVTTDPSGRTVRRSIDSLSDLAQALPWSSTLRVSALRRTLLDLASDLEAIAGARSLSQLAQSPVRAALAHIEASVFALAQLTAGARRRVLTARTRSVPASGAALNALDIEVEQQLKGHPGQLAAVMPRVEKALNQELPPAIANTLCLTLSRMAQLPLLDPTHTADSFTPPAAKEAPLPPWLPARRTLGGFYVVRALGAGGVGSVFVVLRAEERQSNGATQFALKVPDYSAEAARTLSEDEFLNLFRQEAGALLALPEHPNLAGFVTFDAGARPKPILVMELVDGPTLERSLEIRDMTMPEAISVLDGVGAGLQSMHAQGIGHLDIKPSNVILRRSGRRNGAAMPVLVDFGLAGRQIRPGCATGPYGAPEIWGLVPEDHAPHPAAADTYAYACLIYETLTGDTLFDGPSELAIINAHLVHDGYPEKLLALRQHKPLEPMCDLIANGLRQHPGSRIGVDQLRLGMREVAHTLSATQWPLTGQP